MVASYAYYVIPEGFVGWSFGKLLLGLKVVKANGEPYTWGAALLRNVLRIVDGLPVLYLVGLVSIAVTLKKQRIGDLAAGTLVVRAM